MPLVDTRTMLKQAQIKGIAIAAFNIENMEMAQAVVDGAIEANCPVILQTTPSTVRYASVHMFAAMATALAKQATVDIAMHLDHGSSFDLAMDAIEAGYTSVMFDGSQLSFEDNVISSKKVVEASNGTPVEAELGSVGGKEDDHEAANAYTDPGQAADFVAATGIDSLAIAIGTAHGFYQGTPKLDIDRLIEIRKRVSIPLVLHGASGLSQEAVQTCVREGICKVNIATELRTAYSEGVKAYLSKNQDAYDPKSYGTAGYNTVKQMVIEKIAMVTEV